MSEGLQTPIFLKNSNFIETNIGLMRSFWSVAYEIWEICEPSKFPHKPC